MSLYELVFFFFFIVTLSGAGFILFSKDVINSAFSLLVCFLGVAALFILAGADFIGITQIMIYIGGILVLLLFGIMLTRRISDNQTYKTRHKNTFLGIVAGAGIFSLLVVIIVKVNFLSLKWINNPDSLKATNSTIRTIGINLMTDYILPFEVAALILMLALLGSAFIAAQVVRRKS